jgi:restriction endonuclease Mrr
MTNAERLQQAGMLDSADSLSSEQLQKIENLSPGTVEALISANENLQGAQPDLKLGIMHPPGGG